MAAAAIVPAAQAEAPSTAIPEGDYKIYTRSGKSLQFDAWEGALYEMEQDVYGFYAEVVFGADNKVWMRNILTFINADYWTEGRVEGDKIIIPAGQVIAVDPYAQCDVLLYPAEMSLTGEGESTELNINPTDAAEITYTITETGISLDNCGDANHVIAGFLDSPEGLAWNEMADFLTVYTASDVTPALPPSGLETKTCNWIYTNPNKALVDLDDLAGFKVSAGIDGDKLYLTDFNGNLTLVGDIADGKVTFADGQLTGLANAYPMFLRAVNATIIPTEWGQMVEYAPAGADIVFDFDADTMTLSNPSSDVALCTSDDVAYPMAGYIKPKLSLPSEGAIVPKAPAFTDVRDLAEWGELPDNEPRWAIALRSSIFGVDDAMMDRSKLYFRIWVNGNDEPYVFKKDLYSSLEEDITDVPLTYSDQDFFISMDTYQNYYLFEDNLESIRACLVYKGGDTERVSESALWQAGGISGVNADDNCDAQVYDIAGRPVKGTPAPGIYIKGNRKIIVK